ncbi:15438_t:CDS:2, partial [Entrophospora sp. SA101]
LKGCKGVSEEVMKKLNPKIKIEHPDYSDDEFSDSDLPPLIPDFAEGKIPVKALIDTTSKSNTISNRLYNKLEEDYGLEGISGDDLIGKEIKCLDLQFR